MSLFKTASQLMHGPPILHDLSFTSEVQIREALAFPCVGDRCKGDRMPESIFGQSCACSRKGSSLELRRSTEQRVLYQHRDIGRRRNACSIKHTNVISMTPARCPTPHCNAQPILTGCCFPFILPAQLPRRTMSLQQHRRAAWLEGAVGALLLLSWKSVYANQRC